MSERGVVRVETHQRRIRLAMHKLNKALEDAKAAGVRACFDIQTADNHDREVHALGINEWLLDEPEAPL